MDDQARIAPTLETSRLTLRAHTLDDFAVCAEMWASPIVTRHIGGRPLHRRGVVEPAPSLCRALDASRLRLLGDRRDKRQRRASGRRGSRFADFHPRTSSSSFAGAPEAGWVLAPWSYPQRLSRPRCHRPRRAPGSTRTRDPARTVCIIDPANVASIRVAEKCGYVEWTKSVYHGAEVVSFERRRRAWTQSIREARRPTGSSSGVEASSPRCCRAAPACSIAFDTRGPFRRRRCSSGSTRTTASRWRRRGRPRSGCNSRRRCTDCTACRRDRASTSPRRGAGRRRAALADEPGAALGATSGSSIRSGGTSRCRRSHRCIRRSSTSRRSVQWKPSGQGTSRPGTDLRGTGGRCSTASSRRSRCPSRGTSSSRRRHRCKRRCSTSRASSTASHRGRRRWRRRRRCCSRSCSSRLRRRTCCRLRRSRRRHRRCSCRRSTTRPTSTAGRASCTSRRRFRCQRCSRCCSKPGCSSTASRRARRCSARTGPGHCNRRCSTRPTTSRASPRPGTG